MLCIWISLKGNILAGSISNDNTTTFQKYDLNLLRRFACQACQYTSQTVATVILATITCPQVAKHICAINSNGFSQWYMTLKITWLLGSVHYWIFQTENISVKRDLFRQSILFQMLDNPKHTETKQYQGTIIKITQLHFLKWVMLRKLDGQSTQS